MFSTSGVQQHDMSYSQISDSHSRQHPSVLLAVGSDETQVPGGTHTPTLALIEDLLESIVDAISSGDELIIPYRSIRSSQNGTNALSPQGDGRQVEVVRFPGRTAQEVKRFEALFRIIEMSHEALLSGNLVTKRNIYYQNPDLFKSQSAVDDMVDNLAFTLGVGREDLNIVAAAKGLISGPIDLILRDGSTHGCDIPGNTGMLLPSVSSIQKINFRTIRWVLVIEKEATFRTLAASQYPRTSQAGHGILLTAKGFPDLATRRFLSTLHTLRPELDLFALVDFDPHGVAIMRTYKYGSQRLDHEENATAPRLRWLGIHSDDILSNAPAGHQETYDNSQSQSSQEAASQDSVAYSFDGSQSERLAKRARISKMPGPSESILPLTQRDRKKAAELMKEISGAEDVDGDGTEQMRELQRMMMLNIKAEIQAVDNYGDIADWLDGKLVTSVRRDVGLAV
ncbi:Spo11/DNA topoisomerase VI subunit A [Parachaetomium inaequale]|uniref:DNA topoisomerase (ATP-hydrolyzing) n=1 Tax=Parachaetomium inaequale TaxID=2588326 RepID=A0AAN6PF53_9PEZI|nr:Spo11/DNA topoisomerase VI subunit A [Parachaetomium inaequale]